MADVNAVNESGVNALMLAASSSGKECPQVMKELILQKVDVNFQDAKMWTALHHACRNGKKDAIGYLLQSHANAIALTKDKKTPLMLSIVEGRFDSFDQLMKSRAVREKVQLRDQQQQTALHYAARSGQRQMIKLLVENSAKVNVQDSEGKGAVMLAAEQGHLEVVKYLHKKGAEVHMKDSWSRSSLILACMNSHQAVAVWLVAKHADPCWRDSLSTSALMIAEDLGLSSVRHAIRVHLRHLEEQQQIPDEQFAVEIGK